jgi:hypothetical protein
MNILSKSLALLLHVCQVLILILDDSPSTECYITYAIEKRALR